MKNIENRIPDVANLATNTTLNAKKNEHKNEIASIINLAIIASKINHVKNKIISYYYCFYYYCC